MRVADTGQNRHPLWIGTYTGESASEGIYLVWLDAETGELHDGGLAAAATDPSFLVSHPRRPCVYAVDEGGGGVAGFRMGASAKLSPLGPAATTGGPAPCHLMAHPMGRHIVSTNYGDGSVAVHRLGEDGELRERTDLATHAGSGPLTDRQEGPHAHSATVAPDGTHLLVADLGTDELRSYRIQPDTGELDCGGDIAARFAPGTGPRHLAVRSSSHIYVAGELNSTVAALRWEPEAAAAGRLCEVPATGGDSAGNYPGEITLSPDERFLYVSNRGADCVSVFAIDAGGRPQHLADTPTGGTWPRHFALVGDFAVAANQNSDSLSVLRRDAETGLLTDTEQRLKVPSPACVLPADPSVLPQPYMVSESS